jgi:hypothetical protein
MASQPLPKTNSNLVFIVGLEQNSRLARLRAGTSLTRNLGLLGRYLCHRSRLPLVTVPM